MNQLLRLGEHDARSALAINRSNNNNHQQHQHQCCDSAGVPGSVRPGQLGEILPGRGKPLEGHDASDGVRCSARFTAGAVERAAPRLEANQLRCRPIDVPVHE